MAVAIAEDQPVAEEADSDEVAILQRARQRGRARVRRRVDHREEIADRHGGEEVVAGDLLLPPIFMDDPGGGHAVVISLHAGDAGAQRHLAPGGAGHFRHLLPHLAGAVFGIEELFDQAGLHRLRAEKPEHF